MRKPRLVVRAGLEPATRLPLATELPHRQDNCAIGYIILHLTKFVKRFLRPTAQKEKEGRKTFLSFYQSSEPSLLR